MQLFQQPTKLKNCTAISTNNRKVAICALILLEENSKFEGTKKLEFPLKWIRDQGRIGNFRKPEYSHELVTIHQIKIQGPDRHNRECEGERRERETARVREGRERATL